MLWTVAYLDLRNKNILKIIPPPSDVQIKPESYAICLPKKITNPSSIDLSGNPLKIMYSGIQKKGEYLRKQQDFWYKILPDDSVYSYKIIFGGKQNEFWDQARKEKGPHSAAIVSYLRLIYPMFLSILDDVKTHELNFKAFLNKYNAIKNKSVTFPTLINLIYALTGSKNKAQIHLRKRIFNKNKTILTITVGGAVSNDFAIEPLEILQQYCNLHIRAIIKNNNREKSFPLLENINLIRERKYKLIKNIKHQNEQEKKLDEHLRYEICLNKKPKYDPLNKSINDKRYVWDIILIIALRTPNKSNSSNSYILSMQSLYALGGIGNSLFHFPYEILKNKRIQFEDDAYEAVHTSNSIGFFSILEVKCKQYKIGSTSPRRLIKTIPAFDDVETYIKEMPQPIVVK